MTACVALFWNGAEAEDMNLGIGWTDSVFRHIWGDIPKLCRDCEGAKATG